MRHFTSQWPTLNTTWEQNNDFLTKRNLFHYVEVNAGRKYMEIKKGWGENVPANTLALSVPAADQ